MPDQRRKTVLKGPLVNLLDVDPFIAILGGG